MVGVSHFSITEACENKQAAASFITFLTSYEGQILEARRGLLPTRERVWQDIIEANRAMNNDFMVQVFKTYQQSMAEDAFTPPLIPEWIEVSNQIWYQLQAAVVGDKTVKEALDDAAEGAREVMEDAGYL